MRFATGIKFTSQGGQDAWATDKYLNYLGM